MAHGQKITADELIATLESDRSFYKAWQTAVNSVLMSFFTTMHSDSVSHGLDIKFGTQYNWLSFSTKQVASAHMSDLVRGHGQQLLKPLSSWFGYDEQREAADYFMDKMTQAITSGETKLPADVSHALSVIYASEQTNIAQACRTLGMTRYAVTKLADTYRRDAFIRYMKVQSGKAYEVVMGDCAPYIHNYPQFDPIVVVREGESQHHHLVTPGALIARSGSSAWSEIPDFYNSYNGRGVYTDAESFYPPFKILPAEYRAVAGRFCSTIKTPAPRHGKKAA